MKLCDKNQYPGSTPWMFFDSWCVLGNHLYITPPVFPVSLFVFTVYTYFYLLHCSLRRFQLQCQAAFGKISNLIGLFHLKPMMVAHMNYNFMIVVILRTVHIQYIPDDPCPNYPVCSLPKFPLSSFSLPIHLHAWKKLESQGPYVHEI
jgi:hypothetical protein